MVDTVFDNHIWDALSGVNDPELGISIVDLGLVYRVEYITAQQCARIVMTLTSPACPCAERVMQAVEDQVKKVPNVTRVDIQLTFDPPWSLDRARVETQQDLALRGIPLTRW